MSDSTEDQKNKVSEDSTAVVLPAEEEDSGITLVDVLEEEQKLEDDADAVLGGSDDQNCTYNQGYVKRQALYSCLTCTPEGGVHGGICLACSYQCHDGHDLIELYTKRNFRCDCGNSKFPNNQCTLQPVKELLNEQNQYNANFWGKYCSCLKPYPDPEDTQPDEMIQCIVCEDWFHLRHLGQRPPEDFNYSEMVCDGCVTKHSFLQAYSTNHSVGEVKEVLEEAKANPCVLEKLRKPAVALVTPKTAFYPSGWRSQLCRCSQCMDMYRDEKLEFLLDLEDTVEFYEERGKRDRVNEPPKSHNEKLMTALSTLDRTQQVELIHGYQAFSSDLKEYLRKFAENKKVVREEDIREFFTQLAARKRQRSSGSVQFFCR